jgi:hypothetical protein
MGILAFVPTPKIEICFLNRCVSIPSFDRQNHGGKLENPEMWLNRVKSIIDDIFRNGPSGGTPLLQKIEHSLNHYHGKRVARYIFADGEPNGGERDIIAITNMIRNRPSPQDNPITLLSCSDSDKDVEWMKTVEEAAKYCAEFDDFQTEAQEVIGDQGIAFPFTKGFYLIGQLVAAMNPYDLDAMDESIPFPKAVLDDMLGIVYSKQDYEYYFSEFLKAQQRKQGNDEITQLKKRTRWDFNEFMTKESIENIPAAMEFKRQIDMLSGNSQAAAIGYHQNQAPQYIGSSQGYGQGSQSGYSQGASQYQPQYQQNYQQQYQPQQGYQQSQYSQNQGGYQQSQYSNQGSQAQPPRQRGSFSRMFSKFGL